MKRLFLSLAVAGSLIGGSAFAETSTASSSPQRLVSLDAGSFVWSLYRSNGNGVLIPLEFEQTINDLVSWYVAPRLGLNWGGGFGLGFGLGLGARFYVLNGPALSGLWLGPEVGLLYAAASSSSASAGLGFSLGGAVGYNIVLNKGFVLSPGVNLGYGGLGTTGGGAFVFSPRINLSWAF